ncbi:MULTISPECIES: lipopolysaccharide assembly protein LapB [unclassified Arthrobacter]|uniref:tetratricopeptide repeat protein n=1 Tax=unclassified Arthrobacter TaxID=235627 RepID=UPI0011B0CA65|nr:MULTISPECIES: hypothetical protein [unclassified Arthrobacter]
MEPISSAILSSLAKTVFGSLSDAAKKTLKKKRLSARVAKAVSKLSSQQEITVSRKALKKWLQREDVKQQIAEGSTSQIDSALNSLAFIIESESPENRKTRARQVLFLTYQEYQRELPINDAMVMGTNMMLNHLGNESETTREIVTHSTGLIIDKIDSNDLFKLSLSKLHPWRVNEGTKLQKLWPDLTELVVSLVDDKERAKVLSNWSRIPPSKLEDAPASVWAWLGTLAEDYGNHSAAVEFIKVAVSKGVTRPDYWFARAALLLHPMNTEAINNLKNEMGNFHFDHSLANACCQLAQRNFQKARQFLDAWDASEMNDRMLKSKIISVCLAEEGDINSSIALLVESIDQDNNSDVLAITAASNLIWRSLHGNSENSSGDLIQAGELALLARNQRRLWSGDSSEPALVAIHAYMLCNDSDRAWKITQAPPIGEATYLEAKDSRILLEAAFVSASKNNFKLAKNIVSQLDNPFATSYIDGWASFNSKRLDEAVDYWFKSFELATNDFDLIRAANALSPLGMGLPDIEKLAAKYPEAISQIREIHEIMSDPDNKIILLRARAGKSELLDSLLAEHLATSGMHHESAELLKAASLRWDSAQLMIMAAEAYFRSENYVLAEKTAHEAVSMCMRGSSGHERALRVRFESLEKLGMHEESLSVARQMVSANPKDQNSRWVLIHALARDGNYSPAWNTLNHFGTALDPRNHHDARLWIFLSSQFDDRPSFVRSALRLIEERKEDTELVGILLANTLVSADKAPKKDLEELQEKLSSYVSENPESSTLRSFKSESIEDLLDVMKNHFVNQQEDQDLVEYERQICEGKLPLGMVTLLYDKTLAEACILRAAGRIFSSDNEQQIVSETNISEALNKHVSLDTTAASTLALLDDKIQDTLIGKFSVLKTTTPIYKDALEARLSLQRRSTMTVGWNKEAQKLNFHSISDDEAEKRYSHIEATVSILERAHRKSWPQISFVDNDLPRSAWLSALDLALVNRTAFWCDDSSLRSLATLLGVPTFGTVALLRYLSKIGEIDEADLDAAEATLVANFHVDMNPDISTWIEAARIDSWKAAGAASYLSFAAVWNNPMKAYAFIQEFIKNNAENGEEDLEIVAFYAAKGVLEFAGDSPESQSSNLQLLLKFLLVNLRLRIDLIPHILKAVRLSFKDSNEVRDPLLPAVEELYLLFKSDFGKPIAQNRIIDILSNLDESDLIISRTLFKRD